MVKSKFKLLFYPSLTFFLSTILVLRSRWGTRTTKKITTSAEQNDFNIEIPSATTSSCSSNIQLRLSEKFLSLWVLVYSGNGTDLGLKLANAFSGNLSHTHILFPYIVVYLDELCTFVPNITLCGEDAIDRSVKELSQPDDGISFSENQISQRALAA